MGTNVYWPVLDGYHFDNARNITLDSDSVVDLKLQIITVVMIFIITTWMQVLIAWMILSIVLRTKIYQLFYTMKMVLNVESVKVQLSFARSWFGTAYVWTSATGIFSLPTHETKQKTRKKLMCERICRCFDFHFEKLAPLPFCIVQSETSQFYSKYHYWIIFEELLYNDLFLAILLNQ